MAHALHRGRFGNRRRITMKTKVRFVALALALGATAGGCSSDPSMMPGGGDDDGGGGGGGGGTKARTP